MFSFAFCWRSLSWRPDGSGHSNGRGPKLLPKQFQRSFRDITLNHFLLASSLLNLFYFEWASFFSLLKWFEVWPGFIEDLRLADSTSDFVDRDDRWTWPWRSVLVAAAAVPFEREKWTSGGSPYWRPVHVLLFRRLLLAAYIISGFVNFLQLPFVGAEARRLFE